MFKKALEHVSERVAEVRVVYPAKNRIVLMVDKQRMEFLSDFRTLSSVHFSLTDALKFVRKHQKSGVSDRDLEIAAINGLLSTLDPHSIFLGEDLYSETKVGTKGSFGGLGIVIGIRKMKLTVIAPLEDTPAFRAGLKAGDTITKIGTESTINMNLTEAVNKMRGARGVPITISVLREGWDAEKDYTIVRDVIRIVSIESELLPNNVGYIKIKNFQGNTAKQLRKYLSDMRKEAGGKLAGLILDVRGNPGGLLDQSIAVADKFLSKGPIVTTVGINNRIREVENATSPETEPNYSMVVLVDPGSASASEIVAGALKRRNRAVIMGRKTFGKGTVQSLFELSERTALKLTIAQYLTPGDHSIQSVGIAPDVEIIPSIFSKDRVDLFRLPEKYGEISLERHFNNPNGVVSTDKPHASIQYFYDQIDDDPVEAEKKEDVEKYMSDFLISAAHQLVLSKPNATRDDLLKEVDTFIPDWKKTEMKKISDGLAKRNIDWSDGPKDPAKNCAAPTASYKITPKRQTPIKAGESVEFVVELHNTGTCTLYRAWAQSESKNYIFSDREFLFGKVNPGQRVSRSVRVEIPKSMPSSLTGIQLHFEESQGLVPKDQDLRVAIQSIGKPKFAFTYEINDSNGRETKGNGNALIEPGETVELKLHIQNVGQAKTEEASASVRNLSGNAIFLKKGRISLPEIKPGKEETVSFLFDVRSMKGKETPKLDLTIADLTYRTFASKEIELVKKEKDWLRPPAIQTKSDNLAFQFMKDRFVRISGTVSDDQGSRDLYILVNGKKVFYQSFPESQSPGQKESFETSIPLEKGINRVMLIARDHQDLIERKAFVLQRTDPKSKGDDRGYSMDDFLMDLPAH